MSLHVESDSLHVSWTREWLSLRFLPKFLGTSSLFMMTSWKVIACKGMPPPTSSSKRNEKERSVTVSDPLLVVYTHFLLTLLLLTESLTLLHLRLPLHDFRWLSMTVQMLVLKRRSLFAFLKEAQSSHFRAARFFEYQCQRNIERITGKTWWSLMKQWTQLFYLFSWWLKLLAQTWKRHDQTIIAWWLQLQITVTALIIIIERNFIKGGKFAMFFPRDRDRESPQQMRWWSSSRIEVTKYTRLTKRPLDPHFSIIMTGDVYYEGGLRKDLFLLSPSNGSLDALSWSRASSC